MEYKRLVYVEEISSRANIILLLYSHFSLASTVVSLLISKGGTLSDVATFCHYYYEYIYFFISPQATSLMWLQFLGK